MPVTVSGKYVSLVIFLVSNRGVKFFTTFPFCFEPSCKMKTHAWLSKVASYLFCYQGSKLDYKISNCPVAQLAENNTSTSQNITCLSFI